MCFAPQQRAIFRHLNFKKWSGAMSLSSILTCTCASRQSGVQFSTSELQKVVQAPHRFNILTCKCASRHSSVPFFDIWTSKSGPVPWVCLAFWLAHVLRAKAAYNFSTSELQKVVQAPHRFNILTCKCASRHSSVPFFDIWTSKSGPVPWVCLAFWLAHVLRAKAAYNFSTSELQKVVQAPHRFNILTCKCASRHSSLPFFSSLPNSYLRTRHFSEPAFRTSGTTNQWKAIRDSPNVWHLCIFFLLTFSHLWLLSSDLTSLLAFQFNCPYCRKLDF